MHIDTMQLVTTETEGIYRFTMEICETEEAMRKLMLQIDKQVEVFKSFYNSDTEVLWKQHDMFVKDLPAINQTISSAAAIERSAVA
jgi:acetolactate synthase-1/3 small subunit